MTTKGLDMIILNGKKFAESEDEFTSSLFESGGTCVGYARKNKCSVTLYNMQHEKIGVINKHGCLCKATKKDCGRWWYSFATIEEVGEYTSYMQAQDDTAAALAIAA